MRTETNELTPGMGSSADSVKESRQFVTRLCEQIIDLARKAEKKGLTINEAERLIEDHKGHSVSPRFAELVRQGRLVRVLVGRGAPTKRFPQGVPRLYRRYDDGTCRSVIVHWLPEFVPPEINSRTNNR